MRGRIILRLELGSDQKHPDLEGELESYIVACGFKRLSDRIYRMTGQGYIATIVYEETKEHLEKDEKQSTESTKEGV